MLVFCNFWLQHKVRKVKLVIYWYDTNARRVDGYLLLLLASVSLRFPQVRNIKSSSSYTWHAWGVPLSKTTQSHSSVIISLPKLGRQNAINHHKFDILLLPLYLYKQRVVHSIGQWPSIRVLEIQLVRTQFDNWTHIRCPLFFPCSSCSPWLVELSMSMDILVKRLISYFRYS